MKVREMINLRNNTEVKIIPEDIKSITKGVIKEIQSNSFTVNFIGSMSFNTGDFLEIIISDNGNIFKFDCKVIKNELNLLTLSLPENVHQPQRREYPRVDISIPVVLNDTKNPDKLAHSITKNISGGGTQVISNVSFEKGSMLKASFKIIGKDTNIETLLEVLRIERDNNKKNYFLSGQFKNLSNSDKTTLIQVCFKRQLELKSKGVIKINKSSGGETN